MFLSGDTAGCDRNRVPTVRAEAAVIWLGAGRLDKSAKMTGVFTADVLAGLPPDSDWLLTLQCVLEGAVAVGDRAVAIAVVTLLAPYAGRSVVNAGAVMWRGVTDDTLPRAYALLEDSDTSARHRSAALATYERIGAIWWSKRLRAQLPAEPAAPSNDIVMHLHQRPAGCGWSTAKARRSCCRRCGGCTHLHVLLARPDTDIPARDLMSAESVAQTGLDLIDDEGRRVLAARLTTLDAELEFEDRADLREERDAITAYLAGSWDGQAAADSPDPTTNEHGSPWGRPSWRRWSASRKPIRGWVDSCVTASRPVWNAASSPTPTIRSVGYLRAPRRRPDYASSLDLPTRCDPGHPDPSARASQ